MDVGEKIKELRKSRGLTQKEFGELLEPNVADSTVACWEKGYSKPRGELKVQVAEMANESVGEFFGSKLIGNVYNELTVIDDLGTNFKDNARIIVCECSCGNIKKYRANSVRTGNAKSCGCLKSKIASENGKNMAIRTKDFLEKDTVEKGTRLSNININKKVSKSNTSGKTGVAFSKSKQKWQAYIYLKRKQFNLGYFDKKEDAIKARLKAEEEYFVPVLEKHKDVFEQ